MFYLFPTVVLISMMAVLDGPMGWSWKNDWPRVQAQCLDIIPSYSMEISGFCVFAMLCICSVPLSKDSLPVYCDNSGFIVKIAKFKASPWIGGMLSQCRVGPVDFGPQVVVSVSVTMSLYQGPPGLACLYIILPPPGLASDV